MYYIFINARSNLRAGKSSIKNSMADNSDCRPCFFITSWGCKSQVYIVLWQSFQQMFHLVLLRRATLLRFFLLVFPLILILPIRLSLDKRSLQKFVLPHFLIAIFI